MGELPIPLTFASSAYAYEPYACAYTSPACTYELYVYAYTLSACACKSYACTYISSIYACESYAYAHGTIATEAEAMAHNYPPIRELDLLASTRLFLEQIAILKEQLALPEDFENALAEWHAQLEIRLAAVAQAKAQYHQAKQAKDEAYRAVQNELRRLTRQLRVHPEFTDAMARQLGMPVYDRTLTPVLPGEEIPMLQVETHAGQHWVYFWQEDLRKRGRRGKPRWARAARILYAITPVNAPPPPHEQLQFLASATRSPFLWTPPPEAIGQWVWYRAAWETPRGALGGWSGLTRAIVG